jgi:hypothetical protein
MTAINTVEGLREIVRTPDGIVLAPNGPLGSGAWVLSDESAGQLVELLSGLTNDTPAKVLGEVEALTSIGRRPLTVTLRGAVVELQDRRKMSLLRWNVRMVDQVEALAAALADALATDAITEPVPVPQPIDPADVPLPDGPRAMRTQTVRDRVR